MDNKKISFSAQDNGVTSMMERLKRQSDELMRGFISDSQKYSEKSRDQLKFIEDQIKAIERRNRLDKESQMVDLQQAYQGRIEKAAPYKRAGIEKEFDEKKAAIGSSQGVDDMQIRLLREIVETIKITAREEIAEDRKDVEKEVRSYERMSSRNRAEMPEDEALKRSVQRDELTGGGKGGGRGVFWDVLGANLVTGALGKIAGAAGNITSGMANARDPDLFATQVYGETLGGIEWVGGALKGLFADSEMRHLEEEFARDTSHYRMRARTKAGMGSMSAHHLGYSESEFNPVAAMVAGTLGSSDKLDRNTTDLLTVERAFEIDRGMSMQMLAGQRLGGGGSVMGGFTDMMSTFQSKGLFAGGDYSQLLEVLETQNQLIQEQSQTVEEVDLRSTANIVGALRQVGGSFGDARGAARASQINRALANPSNDFQRATNMEILSGLPGFEGASLVDLMMGEEQGMGQEGFLGATLRNLEQRYGSGDEGILAVKNRFNMQSTSAAKLLFEEYQADRTRFDTIKGMPESVQTAMSAGEVDWRARQFTTEREQNQAKITDAFVEGAWPGMVEVGKLTGESMIQGLKDVLESVGSLLPDFAKNKMIDMMKQELGMNGGNGEIPPK